MGSRRARNGLVALLAAGILLAVVPAQEMVHKARPELFDPNRKNRPTSLITVGPAPAVIAAMGGFRPLAADLLWLRVETVWHGGSWWQMLPLLETITQLDPNFELAWKVYGWHCAYNLHAESKTMVDRNYWLQKGLEILERAVDANPNSWDMKWELAWTCYDRAHELARAAEWFYAADQCKGAPDYVSRFYYRAYEKLLDKKGIFEGLAYAAQRHPEVALHQFLVRRDTGFWKSHWDDPGTHRDIIVKENTARQQRGIAPYLYPGEAYWLVCPVCGMPVAKAHTLSASASATPGTVESGAAVKLTATCSDSQEHAITEWSWSDGGAGGSFAPSAKAQSVTYKPSSTTANGTEVTLTVTASCALPPLCGNVQCANYGGPVVPIPPGGFPTVSAGAVAQVKVRPVPHTLLVSPSVGRPVVDSGGTTNLNASHGDSGGHDIATWAWTDHGAGGTFSPSAEVKNPTYTAPAITGGSRRITLTVTGTCAGPKPISGKGSTTITVQPAAAPPPAAPPPAVP